MPLNRRALLGGTLALLTASTARAATPLKVVASSVPHAEILTYVQDKLAPDLPLRIIEISGDIRPNRLVLDGDADANFFQHVPYLRSEEAELGVRFAVTASVHVEPLGLYSRRVRSLADLPKGATIALSTTSPISAAAEVAAGDGLIRLRPGGDGTFATAGDIAENPKSLSFIEVAPPQLPRSLDDVALAVINGNYALESGLDPAKDSLGLERAEGNPYANVLVTTQALAQDARIQTLSSLLQSAEVAGFIRVRYRGAVIPVRGA